MNVATFPCPHCKSPLRINNWAFVDCAVGCPECGEQIEVRFEGRDQAVARKVSPNANPQPISPTKSSFGSMPEGKTFFKRRSSGAKPAPQMPEDRESRFSALLQRALPARGRDWLRMVGRRASHGLSKASAVLSTPVGIAWSVAGVVGLILLILAWPAESSSNQKPALTDSTLTEDSLGEDAQDSSLPDVPSPEFAVTLPDGPIEPLPLPPGDAETLQRQLSRLGVAIQDYADREGRFPVGTVGLGGQPVKDRLSWMAELLVRNAPQAQPSKRVPEPQWDQPWNDPFNDRFVRQQREEFLNPGIPRRVGADRYPATHFVGVAGVGADAPGLPADHPRAGVFGFDRVTRLEDVKDGLAQTLMVAGVSEQLGSWAAGGRPTLRAFTQEPYVEGPDGFGTGEADGMSVLMADGSVRFLSRNVSPVIVRRMASMADGLPLDDSVPEAPDKPQPISPPQTPPPEPDPPVIAQQPKTPPLIPKKSSDPAPPPEPKNPEPMEEPLDVPAALDLKIVKFEQVQDVPFREMLFQLEELCGVPIRASAELPGDQAELWKRPVSLRLTDTTVRGILEAVLEKAGLRYTIEKDHLRLYPQTD